MPRFTCGIEMRIHRRRIDESVSYVNERVHFYVGDFGYYPLTLFLVTIFIISHGRSVFNVLGLSFRREGGAGCWGCVLYRRRASASAHRDGCQTRRDLVASEINRPGQETRLVGCAVRGTAPDRTLIQYGSASMHPEGCRPSYRLSFCYPRLQ